MLDIKFIRENSEKVKEACKNKGFNVDIDKLLELDKKRRSNIINIETLQAGQNKLGKEDIEEARKIKAEIIKIAPDSKKSSKNLMI